jgi:hypothetical protein
MVFNNPRHPRRSNQHGPAQGRQNQTGTDKQAEAEKICLQKHLFPPARSRNRDRNLRYILQKEDSTDSKEGG